MLEPVFKFIESGWDVIKPWQLVDQYEAGIILRLGKFHREISPGLNMKWPLLEQALTVDVIPNIINLDEQSLATKDKREITISCIVTYRIHNAKRALLSIQDVEDAIIDACYGEIGMAVAENVSDDMTSDDFCELLCELCHRRTVKFGVTIESVSIANLCRARIFRHFGIDL